MFNISISDGFKAQEKHFSSFPAIEAWEYLDINTEIVTEIRQLHTGFWLACTDVGGIEINCGESSILAYPAKDIPQNKFTYHLIHIWLPMAYQACGAQVIHASAVVHTKSHRTIAFCGESGSGKSTLAFGLSQKESWQQIADDRVAFTVEDGKIELHHIPDAIKLRPPSAEFFDQQAYSYDEIDWFTPEMIFDSVYILEQSQPAPKETSSPFSIQPLARADGYTSLLNQAVSLTPSAADLNRNLIQDFLALANQVKTFSLSYTAEFNTLDQIIQRIEDNFSN